MINIAENYKLVQDLLSKNNGVYIGVAEYNRYAELASNDLFDKLVGSKNNIQSTYGRNRTLDRRLMPFRHRLTLNVVNGIVQQPEDTALVTAVYYMRNNIPVPFSVKDEDRFAVAFNDPFSSPTEDAPFYIEGNGIMRIFPQSIPSVEFEYLKKPTVPKYAVNIVNNRPVYDSANSVDFNWDKKEEIELTMRILQYAGLSINHGQIVQFTEVKQNQE